MIDIAPQQAEDFGIHYAHCKEMADTKTPKRDLYRSAIVLCDQFMGGLVDTDRLDRIADQIKTNESDAVLALHGIISSHLEEDRTLPINVRLDSQHRQIFRQACETAMGPRPVRAAAPGRAGLATADLA